MEAKTPNGAPAWIELAKKAQLPILKASAKLLTKQIKADASLADMALTIERDPALCLHLFVAANRLQKGEDVEILSLSHVITTLGMQGVVNVVKKAPQLNLHSSDAYQKAYLQAQANSSFAGVMAEHWAPYVTATSAEKIKWATILSGAPTWLMWRIGYGQMRNVAWKQQVDRMPIEAAQSKSFGCLLDDLDRMLGRELGLPAMSQQSLERAERPSVKQWGQYLSSRYLDFLDNDTKLKHLKTKPSTLMSLCNHIAEHISLGWYSHRSLRGQTILAHLTGVPVEQVTAKNHGMATTYSRQLLFSQVLIPAASLLWPYRPLNQTPLVRPAYACWMQVPEEAQKRIESIAKKSYDKVRGIEPEKAVQAKQADPKNRQLAQGLDALPKVKHPPREVNKDVLNDIIGQFDQQVVSFKDIHEIMLTCNKALHDGLGMRRAFICVLNKTGDGLRPLYCVGIEKDSPVRTLNIALDTNRFAAKLITKPASFKVDRDNYSQVKGMLSGEVNKVLQNENFMVMSLFAKGKPIGVVYADACATEDRITDSEYAAFKKICQSTSHALDSYAKRRRA